MSDVPAAAGCEPGFNGSSVGRGGWPTPFTAVFFRRCRSGKTGHSFHRQLQVSRTQAQACASSAQKGYLASLTMAPTKVGMLCLTMGFALACEDSTMDNYKPGKDTVCVPKPVFHCMDEGATNKYEGESTRASHSDSNSSGAGSLVLPPLSSTRSAAIAACNPQPPACDRRKKAHAITPQVLRPGPT